MPQLTKYILHERLGQGNYGTVYRATDMTLNVPRAIKILHAAPLAELNEHALVFVKRLTKTVGRRSGFLAAASSPWLTALSWWSTLFK